MRISYDTVITKAEYIEANKSHCRIAAITFYVLYCTGMVVASFVEDVSILLPLLPGLVTMVFFFEVLQPYVLGAHRYKQTDLLREEYSALLDDEGMTTVGKDHQAQVAWRLFKKWKEIPSSFLLYPNDYTFVIIPKRCLTEEENEEFRSFYRQTLDEIVFMAK